MAVFGRAGRVSITGGNDAIEVQGIMEFLRDAAKEYDSFNIEARKASEKVAQLLVDKARAEAGTVTRNKQATEVMKGIKAKRNERTPTVYLDKSSFVSTTFPNRKRGKRGGKKVTRADVFFGAEFGGGKFGKGNPTSAGAKSWARNKEGKAVDGYRKGGGYTSQFLRHRGRSGYFFWPTVRKEKNNIAKEYLDAIERVLKRLKDGA
jgi:hypothetical protein